MPALRTADGGWAPQLLVELPHIAFKVLWARPNSLAKSAKKCWLWAFEHLLLPRGEVGMALGVHCFNAGSTKQVPSSWRCSTPDITPRPS